MAITLGSSGVTFNDGSAQTTSIANSNTGDLINVQRFGASGTWTKPTGCTRVRVQVVGGGGGAASYCESGGAGGFAEGVYDVTGVSTVAVTIGSGGAGVGYYAAAGDGGTSSFGSYLSASGGYGANRNYSHSGGHGGGGSGGQINLQGGAGSGHTNSVGSWSGGHGGSTYFGGPSAMARNHTNLGGVVPLRTSTGAPGSGGPGNITDSGGNGVGAVGESGMVIVYAYK